MIIGPQKQIKFDSQFFLLLQKFSFSDRKSAAIFSRICIKQDQISTSLQCIIHKYPQIQAAYWATDLFR